MIGDAVDIRAPFEVACVSFVVSCAYAYFCLPFIAPESMSSAVGPGKGGFLAPLSIMMPLRLRRRSGVVTKHYGVIFLCAGIFSGVVCFLFHSFFFVFYFILGGVLWMCCHPLFLKFPLQGLLPLYAIFGRLLGELPFFYRYSLQGTLPLYLYPGTC